MARARSPDRASPALHRTLSSPGVYLWRMFVFLILVGLLAAVLHQQVVPPERAGGVHRDDGRVAEQDRRREGLRRHREGCKEQCRARSNHRAPPDLARSR